MSLKEIMTLLFSLLHLEVGQSVLLASKQKYNIRFIDAFCLNYFLYYSISTLCYDNVFLIVNIVRFYCYAFIKRVI